MKSIYYQLSFRILIVIIFLIMIITTFNIGKKFYYIKNTLQNSEKIYYKTEIAKWNFNVKISVEEEVFNYE